MSLDQMEKLKAPMETEKVTPRMSEPSLYKVVMHNDDFTPMEFVIAALEVFFSFERSIATKVMFEVHKTGKAICGVYSRDIAETKAEKVVDYARKHDYPLLCSIEAT